jgi:prephenate dehydrogenase
VQEEKDARRAIEAQGCEIVELSAAEHDAFAAAVEPLLNEARATFGRALFDLTAESTSGRV